MVKNVGGIDQAIRIVAGVVLIVLAVAGTIGLWGWVGIIPLATGLFNFCPLYRVLGLSTCKMAAPGK